MAELQPDESAEKTKLEPDPMNPDRMTLLIGDEEWPFAMPLVRKNGRWYLDVQGRKGGDPPSRHRRQRTRRDRDLPRLRGGPADVRRKRLGRQRSARVRQEDRQHCRQEGRPLLAGRRQPDVAEGFAKAAPKDTGQPGPGRAITDIFTRSCSRRGRMPRAARRTTSFTA